MRNAEARGLLLMIMLVSVLTCWVPSAEGSGRGTLVIENNTSATLSVRAWQLPPGNASSQQTGKVSWEAEAPRTVPPEKSHSFFNFLPRGQVFVELSAPRVGGGVKPVIRTVWVSGTGMYTLEVFPKDFGKSVMLDAGGSASTSWQSPLVGVWNWSFGGDVTFKSDGTFVQGPRGGRWTKYQGKVSMAWSHGFTDVLDLSADNRNLTGYGFKTSEPASKWKVWGVKR